ncbi:MAG: DUF6125 family protein [bacterium]
MALNKAQLEIFSGLPREGLLEYIDMLQKNWWNLQNNWMAYMNREYGEEAAVRGDSHCFSANARVQMYRLKKMFGLTETLDDLMKAMVLSTLWVNGEFEIWKPDEDRFRIRVTNCYQQVKRLEEGIGELGCKPAGMSICKAVIEVIHPAVETTCIFCPPDEHPRDAWCEWEFAAGG